MTQFSEETRAKIAELCKKHRVRELSLFGSRSRGDNRPDSDFDLLVDFLPDAGIGLIEYSRMQIDLRNNQYSYLQYSIPLTMHRYLSFWQRLSGSAVISMPILLINNLASPFSSFVVLLLEVTFRFAS